MNITNFLKYLFAASLFSFIAMFSLISQADEKIHGAVCQPANVSQALALGFGSSQLGTTNNSPLFIDGNPHMPVFPPSAFYITCPINRSNDDNAIDIWVEFIDPAPEVLFLTCSVFSTSTDFSAPVFVDTISIEHPLFSDPRIAVGKASMLTPFADYDVNVVCALPPQTRLKSFYTYTEVLP